MSQYKLTYFNMKGRAEIPRLLFAKAGVKYEDNRITGEEWGALKEKTPFGSLPLLEVDGVVIAQSYAIISFLAKRFGLNGKNDLDEARVHMICMCVNDMYEALMPLFREKDAEKKECLRKKYETEELPVFLRKLSKLLKENTQSDFFVGNEMTVADIYFAANIAAPSILGVNVDLSAYSNLQALKSKVESDPKIAEWIKNRPQTPM